ncbi:MAG: Mrp/NBP35 family ATP-binding protein [Clostridiales bacterium]
MTKPENCDDTKCKTCKEDCDSRKTDFSAPANAMSKIKKVIGIVSGKGGVGKSMVTSLLALDMKNRGYNTAILDADLTGPSIPQAFGVHARAETSEMGIIPLTSDSGVKIMSINFLLEDEKSPVIWRGPMIGGVVKQFWTDVFWGDVDFMFVDMPPGTGDVPLTVFQSLPVDGLVIVTSPQELVSMIVSKAVNMAQHMNIPILGIVENMSYMECPDCHKKVEIFGKSHVEETAKEFNLEVLGKLPICPELASSADNGGIKIFPNHWDNNIGNKVESLIK